MIHAFVSLTLEGHSTKPVHQERLLTHPGATVGTQGSMSLTPLAGKNTRGRGVICRVTVAMPLLRSQSRSDCYPILLNMQSHILLNMQSHNLVKYGIPRLINMQSRSRESTVAQSQSVTQFC